MIQAQIELYLTAPGRLQFGNWFRQLAEVLSCSAGFVNAQLLEVEGALTPRVVLIYDCRNNLQLALNSPDFAALMRRIEPFLLQKYAINFCKAINFIQYGNNLCADPSMQWPQVERRRG